MSCARCIVFALLLAATASFAIPQLINYQGYLTDPTGIALDTTVALTFRLYDGPGGGANQVWSESKPVVNVQNGLFSTQLGSVTSLPDSLFTLAEVWLSITVGDDSELNPRTRITSAGYSYRVGTVDGTSGGTISGKLSVGSNNVNPGFGANVFGDENEASGDFSTVSGGFFNHATGAVAIVIGGNSNTADGTGAAACGTGNNALGNHSSAIGGGENTASGYAAFTGGGEHNMASGDYSSVIGGGNFFSSFGNTASGEASSVIGGVRNTASGAYAVVAGGDSNIVAGDYAFGGGRRCNIGSSGDGSFAWSDASGLAMGVGLANSFNARASGGVRFWTTADQNDNIGARLPANSSAWTTLCDSTRKHRYGRVDAQEILNKVCRLPIETWSYRVDPQGYRHIGPMAQDFWNAFHLGDDSLSISTIDPDGIALAAIQELAKENLRLQTSNSKLEERVARLETILQSQIAGEQQSLKEEK